MCKVFNFLLMYLHNVTVMTLDFSYQLGGLDLNLKILDEIYHEIWIYVFTRTSKENNGAWKNNGEANTHVLSLSMQSEKLRGIFFVSFM